jgi:putative ABC transport system permease protein
MRRLGATVSVPLVTVVMLAGCAALVAPTVALVDSVWFRELPVTRPARIAVIGSGLTRGVGRRAVPSPDLLSYADFTALRARQDVFETLTAVCSYDIHLPERVTSSSPRSNGSGTIAVRLVTADYFRVFEIAPFMGRTFEPTDEARGDKARVAVLSHAYWQDRLGSPADIIGKAVGTAAGDLVVIGVAPRHFHGETVGQPPDLWAPLTLQERIDDGPGLLDAATTFWLIGLGRLRDGIDPSDATPRIAAALHQIFALRTGEESSLLDAQIASVPITLTAGGRGLLGRVRPLRAAALQVAALQACMCVAVVVFIGRLWRHRPVGEWVIVSLAAAFVAVYMQRGIPHVLSEPAITRAFGVRLDPDEGLRFVATVCGVALALTCAAAAMSWLTVLRPLRAFRRPLGPRAERRGVWSHGGGVIHVSTIILLAAAAVLNMRAGELLRKHIGIRNPNLIVGALHSPASNDAPERVGDTRKSLVDDVGAVPGVVSIAFASSLILSPQQSRTAVNVSGRPVRKNGVDPTVVTITKGFFETLDTPLVAGRLLASDDPTIEPAALVNESFVEAFFGNRPVLGATITVNDRRVRIVGVAKDLAHATIRSELPAVVYLPVQDDRREFLGAVYVRVSDAGATSRVVRALLDHRHEIATVRFARSIEDQISMSVAPERAVAGLAGVAAVVSSLVSVFALCALLRARTGRSLAAEPVFVAR